MTIGMDSIIHLRIIWNGCRLRIKRTGGDIKESDKYGKGVVLKVI